MTTAITFSRKSNARPNVSNTQYWENLVLVVVLVSESKALYSLELDAENGYPFQLLRMSHLSFLFYITDTSYRVGFKVAWPDCDCWMSDTLD